MITLDVNKINSNREISYGNRFYRTVNKSNYEIMKGLNVYV